MPDACCSSERLFLNSMLMKIPRGNLHEIEEPLFFRETLFDIGIHNLGDGHTPVETEIVVHSRGEDFFLDGQVRTTLTLACDRCLVEGIYPLEGKLRVWLVSMVRPDLETDEDHVMVLAAQQLEVDLTEVVAESVYLELPQKTLCREDCKGLCPSCGTNLNQEQCGCETGEIDERWSALLQIKQKLENE
ncbi:MAG: DUF177 domain-containing protein [Candidatus Marinimicrobia bacterium]|nr:DUF177 domain-containing protein [Candidatus Neomarinimicrobiota bacterium]